MYSLKNCICNLKVWVLSVDEYGHAFVLSSFSYLYFLTLYFFYKKLLGVFRGWMRACSLILLLKYSKPSPSSSSSAQGMYPWLWPLLVLAGKFDYAKYIFSESYKYDQDLSDFDDHDY